MSYSLNNECVACIKKDKCTDRHFIAGAISGIHQVPFGTSHLGCGTVTIACSAIEKKGSPTKVVFD